MDWLNNINSELVAFQRSNRAFAIAVWVANLIASHLLAWLVLKEHNFVLGTLGTLTAGYITLLVCSNRWKELSARMAVTTPTVWSVSVNNVLSCELTDADYARILLTVEFDLKTHILQMIHFISRIYQIFTNLVLIGPIFIFWTAVAVLLYSPSELATTLDILKTVTRADLRAAISTFISLVGMPIILYVIVSLLWSGLRFSQFHNAIATKVLQKIECPATGQVTLSQFMQGGVLDKFEIVN